MSTNLDKIKKTYTYDSFDRVAKMVYTDLEHPETVMESYAYSYDKNSNIEIGRASCRERVSSPV